MQRTRVRVALDDDVIGIARELEVRTLTAIQAGQTSNSSFWESLNPHFDVSERRYKADRDMRISAVIKQQGCHHSGDQAARRPQILCSSCVHSFGALAKAMRLFTASLHSRKMPYQACSIDSYVDLQPFGCNFKGGLFDNRFGD